MHYAVVHSQSTAITGTVHSRQHEPSQPILESKSVNVLIDLTKNRYDPIN